MFFVNIVIVHPYLIILVVAVDVILLNDEFHVVDLQSGPGSKLDGLQLPALETVLLVVVPVDAPYLHEHGPPHVGRVVVGVGRVSEVNLGGRWYHRVVHQELDTLDDGALLETQDELLRVDAVLLGAPSLAAWPGVHQLDLGAVAVVLARGRHHGVRQSCGWHLDLG